MVDSATITGEPTLLSLNVKLINNRSIELAGVPTTIGVRAFKTRVKDVTEIPEDRQRLLYRGRLLEDHQTLSSYSIENGHTIHCVARPAPQDVSFSQTDSTVPGRAATSDANTGASQVRRVHPLGTSARLLTDVIRMAGSGDPTMMPLRASRGPDRVTAAPDHNSLEHIRQGLLTMHTLLSVMHEPNRTSEGEVEVAQSSRRGEEEEDQENNMAVSSSSSSREVVRSSHRSLQERDFFVGQWLDVKDTVNQWLEATVMEINRRERLVKIHYNGWPVRWDEWIPFSSQRIAPFRTRTLHSSYSPFMSPSPITSVTNAPMTGRDDVRVVIPEVLGMVRTMGNYLESLSDLCEQRLVEEEEEQGDGAANMDTDQQSQQSSRPYLERLPWAAEQAREEGRRRRRQEMNADSSSEDDDEGEGNRKMPATEGAQGQPCRNMVSSHTRRSRMRSLAADVAPLLDRCGRLLADLAPHVLALNRDDTPSTIRAETSVSAEVNETTSLASSSSSSSSTAENMEMADEDATPMVSAPPPRGYRRARLGRPPNPTYTARSRTPSPDTAFRQLVSTSARNTTGLAPASAANVDIHILLTPLRSLTPPTGAPPSGQAATATNLPAPQQPAGNSNTSSSTTGNPNTSMPGPQQGSASALLSSLLSGMDPTWLSQPLLSRPGDSYGTAQNPPGSAAPPMSAPSASTGAPAPAPTVGFASTPRPTFLSPHPASRLPTNSSNSPSNPPSGEVNPSAMAAATSMGSAGHTTEAMDAPRAGDSLRPTAYYGILSSSSLLAGQAPAPSGDTVAAASSSSSSSAGTSSEVARHDSGASSSSSPSAPEEVGQGRFQQILSLLRRVTGAGSQTNAAGNE